MGVGFRDVVEDGFAVGVGDEVGIGAGISVVDAVGAGLFTTTPLSQINFFPDLMQVNFLLPTIWVALAWGQEAPALAAAPFAVFVAADKRANKAIVAYALRFIDKE